MDNAKHPPVSDPVVDYVRCRKIIIEAGKRHLSTLPTSVKDSLYGLGSSSEVAVPEIVAKEAYRQHFVDALPEGQTLRVKRFLSDVCQASGLPNQIVLDLLSRDLVAQAQVFLDSPLGPPDFEYPFSSGNGTLSPVLMDGIESATETFFIGIYLLEMIYVDHKQPSTRKG